MQWLWHDDCTGYFVMMVFTSVCVQHKSALCHAAVFFGEVYFAAGTGIIDFRTASVDVTSTTDHRQIKLWYGYMNRLPHDGLELSCLGCQQWAFLHLHKYGMYAYLSFPRI